MWPLFFFNHPLLSCLSLHLRDVGIGIRIYFPIHSLCCLVVQLLRFCDNQVLKPVNQFDISSLLVEVVNPTYHLVLLHKLNFIHCFCVRY